MRDIAQAVGLQAGSLYAHISSKQDVLFTLVRRTDASFLELVDRVLGKTDEPVVERLRQVARAHLQHIADNLPMATVFFHEWRGLDEERRSQIVARRHDYERRVADLLDEGMREGAFRPLDADLSARAILSLLNALYMWFSPGGPKSAVEVADVFTQLVLEGMRSEARHDREVENAPGRNRRAVAGAPAEPSVHAEVGQ